MRIGTLAGCAMSLFTACQAATGSEGPDGGGGGGGGGIDRRWEVGYRTGVALADGEPSNDIPIPVGVFGRYRWNEAWALGASLELSKGDYERPYEIAGELSPEEFDGESEWTTLALWCERTFAKPASKNAWFLALGLGYASVDVEDPESGPLVGGGTFDIVTEADDEIILSLGGGYRRLLGSAWGLEAMVRYDEHLADWEVRDINTGAEGSIDNYGALVFLVGVTFGF